MADETPRKGLGRGLSALLGDDAGGGAAPEGKARGQRDVPIEHLVPGPFQPRQHFAENDMQELVASIREHGVLQPILVRRSLGGAERYEIVAGERRWRAAQRARLTQVPVLIKDLNDGEALEVALIENVQRTDLSPIEEAIAYRRLADEFSHTQEQIAKLIGRSRSHIANTLRLLNLPKVVQEMLHRGVLTAGHGRALLSEANPEFAARRIIADGLNVRQSEESAARARGRANPPAAKDADTVELEASLAAQLGMKVAITFDKKKGRGTLRLDYRSLDQLDELCRRLLEHPLPERDDD